MKTPQQRKYESIEKLKQDQIPYIEHLPHIESSEEAYKRSAEEIAKRAIACLHVIQVACDLHNNQYDMKAQNFILNSLKAMGVSENLTQKEQAVLEKNVSEQDIINMIWKYEAYWVLLWALGIVEKLDYPDHTIDCDFAINAVASCESFDSFMQKVKLRNLEEILDQADLIYRYDWACVDARLKQQPPAAQLNPSVVIERHGVLNWLIREDDDWDFPDTNT